MIHPDELTFFDVSELNRRRANRWHPKFPDQIDGWSGADWSNATEGEAGELIEAVQAILLASSVSKHLGLAGNVVKKLRRVETGIQQAEQGDDEAAEYMEVLRQKLATEIGDVYIYLDLLAQFYGLDIVTCIADTFDRVSKREGFPEVIDLG